MVDYPWPVTYWAAADQAAPRGLEPYHLLGIGEVETRNDPGSEGRPLIRVERHYFRDRVDPDKMRRADQLRLFTNPSSQADRWNNYGKLAQLNDRAAKESHSWGIGQVMGANWQSLGYEDVDDFVNAALTGPEGQFYQMARFLDVNGLMASLREGNLEKVARVYNGPNHAQNNYVAKLRSAIEEHRRKEVPPRPDTPSEPEPPTPEPPEPDNPLFAYPTMKLAQELIRRGASFSIQIPGGMK